MTVLVVEDAKALAVRGAEMFAGCIKESVAERGAVFAALSGGTTPRAMHRLLAGMPYAAEIPWGNLHLFWVDDRCVPYDDPASNYGAALEDLLSRVSLRENQVHPMPTHVSPVEGARQYEKALHHVPLSSNGFPRFDVVFLGIGPDGHTASLFPGQAALQENKKWILAVKGGNPNVDRLTMTFPVLNQARHVVVLISGEKKAPMAKAVLEERRRVYPAEYIHPAQGRLTWLLDRAAASLLSNEVSYEAG